MRVQDSTAICVLLCYCIQTITSRVTYMNPFRSRSSNGLNTLTGMKTQGPQSGPPSLDKIILRNANLKAVDEKYSLCNGIDIREISILEIQKLFETGVLNSVTLTDCYLQRIHRMNHILHAVIEINSDAISQAHEADLERAYGYETRGLIHGIPVLLKDNIDTLDRMETTTGALALLGIRPKRDADVVRALRKAGAVIIGKSNLSEFANFRGTNNIPSGWSGRGGQTLNTYNLNEDPSGSSSGSAVAVAANLVTVSIGTETDGSLIAPSALAGLCTVKATLGLVSTQGVIPISHNQDNVGPMTRTMTDLTILFDTIVSKEVKDRYACGGSYMQCILQNESRSKFRLGILRNPFWDLSAINSTYLEVEIPQLNAIVESLKKSPSFDVVDPVASEPGLLEGIFGTKELTVLLHDFKHDLNQYLERDIITPYAPSAPYHAPNGVKRIASLKDVIQFNIDNPEPQGYNQELLILAEATDGLQNRTYLEALNGNRGFARKLLDSVLTDYKLDAIVFPGEPRILPIPESLEDAPIFGDSVAAIAGYPSVLLPAGIGLNGVPFGINFVGRPYSEAKLFQIAHEVELMTRRRVSPQFLV